MNNMNVNLVMKFVCGLSGLCAIFIIIVCTVVTAEWFWPECGHPW